MTNEENNAPVKEIMPKGRVRFQDMEDVDSNSKIEEQWDTSKNSKFKDNLDGNKNSGSSSKKNAVLMEILYDVAGKLANPWDSHHDEKQGTQTGDGSAEKSEKEGDQKNLDNTNNDNNAEKQETYSVESPSEGGGKDSSSSHPTSGNPTFDSPHVQAPVPTSQSGLEE